jgi:hypothetical protein
VSHPIILVGNTVNHTIRDMGHFTVNFSGNLSEVLPGTVYVEPMAVPDLAEGTCLSLFAAIENDSTRIQHKIKLVGCAAAIFSLYHEALTEEMKALYNTNVIIKKHL